MYQSTVVEPIHFQIGILFDETVPKFCGLLEQPSECRVKNSYKAIGMPSAENRHQA